MVEFLTLASLWVFLGVGIAMLVLIGCWFIELHQLRNIIHKRLARTEDAE